MEEVQDKAIFRSVTVYIINNYPVNAGNLLAPIEHEQDVDVVCGGFASAYPAQVLRAG